MTVLFNCMKRCLFLYMVYKHIMFHYILGFLEESLSRKGRVFSKFFDIKLRWISELPRSV
ncbi:hypothetical protein [Chlamydia felis Fe/C-56]|uniref:Uncharacterized protein n=1 Tax=Chlamydia felis (strain Fe/C-56) TaxID=264202 RepID=Q255N0_CHLFF|nr:hypothetical protein [Chlamydia felis Fe/C-56]